MLARMSSAVLVQRTGLGSALVVSMKAVMAACNWPTLRCTPRRSFRSVSSAKNHSTWFSQDALVGVKCTCQRGRLSSQAFTVGALWVA